MAEWNWTEGYKMSGWDDDNYSKLELEVELDLQQASEWMNNLDDDLSYEEKKEAFKTVLGSLSQKRGQDLPEDQEKPKTTQRSDIRPSDVRMTELERNCGKGGKGIVHFYSGHKVVSDKWLGSRSLEDWPNIFEHMKKNMNPNFDDVNAPKLKWAPKES